MSFFLNLEKGFRCLFCQRVFDSPQAVGGHLRAHREEIKGMKSWNFPGHFSNSESSTSITQPLTISHPGNFSEGAGSHPSCLILNGVCQFNTDEIQSFMDGMSLSENPLPCFRNNYCGKLPSLVNAVPDVDQGLNSNQSPGLKELSPLDSLAGKRGCSGEARGTAGTVYELKRTKINSDEMELDGPPKRELLLYKEEDNSNSVSGMPFDLEDGETNLDLSLHL